METMEEWSHLTASSAAEIAAQADLEEPATDLVTDGMRPEQFVTQLRERGYWSDAIAVMAWALPVRKAIGWACLCDRSTAPEDDDPRHDALLDLVETWVHEPTDEHRQAAFELAQEDPDEGTGEMLGTATGFSEGELRVGGNAPAEVPTEAVPPMIAGAVMMAAGRVDAPEVDATYEEFVRRAIEIAADRSGRGPEGESA